MTNVKQLHSFHIPVMGIGFTIDTPLKVSKFGISSAISLVDDVLIEKMRQHYSMVYEKAFEPIPVGSQDCRAKRITAYLNLINTIVNQQCMTLREQPFEEGCDIVKYFEMLPNTSPVKQRYLAMQNTNDPQLKAVLQTALRKEITAGAIDVNIMTKIDGESNESCTTPHSSYALSALRGYAKSNLLSGVVFSAGLNKQLYSYANEFDCFYHKPDGAVEKRIIIKVSDYRSALTQGKLFAKKGLWVSEYRIESGLNCGGHAFATKGLLLGSVLQDFKKKRLEFVHSIHDIYTKALTEQERYISTTLHPVYITAQGGVGTASEHNMLLNYYELNSIGWGSPMLLVPEATSVDNSSLEKLINANSDDFWMSDVSPMNTFFQNLRTSSSEVAKNNRIKLGTPGSSCKRGYLRFNTEFTKQPICTASSKFQKLKIEQISNSESFTPDQKKDGIQKVIEKACICYDISTSALIKHKIEVESTTVTPAVCPGPNLQYFKKMFSLSEMISHIYGRSNVIGDKERPHMFVNELKLYMELLVKKVFASLPEPQEKENIYFKEFTDNLRGGINHYLQLTRDILEETEKCHEKIAADLSDISERLEQIISDYNTKFAVI